MLPRDLKPEQFNGYPPEARKLVTGYISALQRVPLSFLPSLLREVVDYDFMRATIRSRLARGHVNLQETLIEDLAGALLAHPGVVAVRVCTEKPDVYDDVAGVGIEVLRFKDPG